MSDEKIYEIQSMDNLKEIIEELPDGIMLEISVIKEETADEI
jgi:hypothetical protein